VFPFAFAFEAVPERLAMALVALTMVFEQAPALLRQGDGMLAGAGHANRLDQPLLAEVGVDRLSADWLPRRVRAP
jgi:hypothetical protein